MPSFTVNSCVMLSGAVLLVVAATMCASVNAAAADCHTSDSPVLCHGVRVVRSVVNMRPMRIIDGVEIVRIARNGSAEADQQQRSTTGNGYVDRVMQYLQAHEIKISISELVQRSGVVEVVGRALKEVESENEVVGMCSNLIYLILHVELCRIRMKIDRFSIWHANYDKSSIVAI